MVNDGRRTVEGGIVPVERLQVDGHQARLPVVSVEHVGTLSAAAQVLEGGAGEEREAQPVVPVVLAGARPIRIGPVEEGAGAR